MTSLPRRTTPTLLIATGCLLLGSTGGAAAGRMVSGKQIKNNSVTSLDIKNRTLGTQDLAPAVQKALKVDPRMGRVSQYSIVTESLAVEGGPTETAVATYCPAGTRVLGASGWWEESNEAVAIVIGAGGSYVAAFTQGVRVDDVLVARATCGAVVPAAGAVAPRGGADKRLP